MSTMTQESPMTMADRIKQLRKDHGQTQEDLAGITGVSVVTIQRVERGKQPSAHTICSLAAAFGMSSAELTSVSKAAAVEPTVGSYLPLAEIRSGKQLVDFIAASSALDFDYMEIEDESVADLLERLYQFCEPRPGSGVPSNPSDRIRLGIEASKLLKEIQNNGLTLSGETYDRTAHEVDDDGGCGMAILMASWEETCLVLRVGTGGVFVDRADVEARMDKWTNTNDPRIVRPEPIENATSSEESSVF